LKVLAACIGTAQPIAAKSGTTGHFKVPQAGSVTVGPNRLAGDTIVDRKHHGGPEQAAYIFGETDRVWWADHLDHALRAGFLVKIC
jgi:MOSC domain-containing protein YiiM